MIKEDKIEIVEMMRSLLKENNVIIFERFDKVDKRFQQMDERFDRIDERFETLEKTVTDTNTRVASLEKTVTDTNTRVASLEKTVGEINIKTTSIQQTVEDLAAATANQFGIVLTKLNSLEDRVQTLEICTKAMQADLVEIRITVRKLNDMLSNIDETKYLAIKDVEQMKRDRDVVWATYNTLESRVLALENKIN